MTVTLGSCVKKFVGGTAPKKILDLPSLSLAIDNDGTATLSLSILSREAGPVVSPSFKVSLTPDVTFCGYVEADSPRQVEGSQYIEHSILARGIVGDCDDGISDPIDLTICKKK